MYRLWFMFMILSLLLAACQDTAVPTPTPPPTALPPTAVPETGATAVPETGATAVPTVSPTTNQFPPAPITHDEGGPVSLTGVVTYTNPFFTMGIAAPVIILEDQAGFVDRNQSFLMPIASQALGQITTDFFDSPFSYSLALPIEPQGSLRDVDHDDEIDSGVQIFAVAYWTNTFGDPFLEERDLTGGGWSTAYASTRVSDDPEKDREIIGGHFLVYAPDSSQGFPTGFGPDGLLFTADDPIVALPTGYTLVNLDTDPFTFDRSRHPRIDLLEPAGAALVDYSDLSYADAFHALVDQLSREYAFTELKGIDWEALRTTFAPRFAAADQQRDAEIYRLALRDFAWAIPDGHVSGPFVQDDFVFNVAGGIGLALQELSDGRFLVNYLLPDGPAAAAGIQLGAEVLQLNDQPISDVVDQTIAYTAPFSTDHARRLNQTIFATRFPMNTPLTLTYQNPGSSPETVALVSVFEQDSFYFALGDILTTGYELPLEYRLLDNGYVYVQIYSFSDNDLLTVQLWERLMRTLNDNDAPGLIIDMRHNGGGSGFLADQMAAYFFNEPLSLGNTGYYDKERGEFYFDPRSEKQYYLPAADLRYDGPVAVIIGPECASACEFFTYNLTLQERAMVVGHYPTAGLGGSIDRVLMPEGEEFTFTQGRAVNGEGQIHIEGQGVPPTVRVPITADIVLSERDVLLETAVSQLDQISDR